MIELESQIAKIQLGNLKRTSTYVFTIAEKASASSAELYVVAELPLLSPAAVDLCEKICLAVSGGLKRIYKRPLAPDSFENAIAEINEELSKLASLGQTHWIDKLNAIVAVKNQNTLTISTTGKITAYLVRNSEFTDISCSSEKAHPLKTFENYATGKIRLGDIVILSTTQLFNFISIDRLKQLLESSEFLTAAQSVIEILKRNAGPEIAFGALLNSQVPWGETSEERIDLENLLVETQKEGKEGLLKKIGTFVKSAFALDRGRPAVVPDITKPALSGRLKKIYSSVKNLFGKSRKAIGVIKQSFISGQRRLDLQNFKTFSPQKKFFFFSAALLLLALIINLIVSINLRNNKKIQAEFLTRLEAAQEKISDAESSLLYKDELSAKNFLVEAQSFIPPQNEKLSGQTLENYKTTLEKFEEIKQKLEKTVVVQAQSISSLGQSQNLIILPNQIATQINGQILSYNIETGQLKDGELKVDEEIKAQVSLNNNASVIYNGQGLMIWQHEEGTTGTKFYQNVPGEDEFVGLAKYPQNNRVYAINKKTGQIISFLVTGNQLTRPVIAAASQAQDLKTAQDIAIDGNIFVLSENSGITKYYAGRLAEFKEPTLITPLSGKGKIYTDPDFKHLYVMDAGNNRIVILSPSGEVVQTLTSPEFTDLKDFYVDETNKTIYILNDTILLKVVIP